VEFFTQKVTNLYRTLTLIGLYLNALGVLVEQEVVEKCLRWRLKVDRDGVCAALERVTQEARSKQRTGVSVRTYSV